MSNPTGPAFQGPMAMAEFLRTKGMMVELDQDAAPVVENKLLPIAFRVVVEEDATIPAPTTGDARCGFCDSPMPCHCLPPGTLAGHDIMAYFPTPITPPTWRQPTRLDFWTWEIESQDCHCLVRRYRDGRKEMKSCSRHGWLHLLEAEDRLVAFLEMDPLYPSQL